MIGPPQAGPLSPPELDAAMSRRDADLLVVARRPSVPLVQMRALLRGPGGPAARLAAACLLRRTGARELVDQVGATTEVTSRPDGILVTACVEPAQARPAADLLLRLLRPSAPPAADVVAVEAARLEAVDAAALGDPGELTRRAALAAAFAPTSPYAERADAALADLTPDHVQQWHAAAGEVVGVLCGELDVAADWGTPVDSLASADRVRLRPVGSRRWQVRDRPGSAQTTLRAVAPIPRPGSAERAPAAVAERLLGGGGKGSRLVRELREKRGFGYHPGTSLTDLAGTAYVLLEVDVATEVTAAAVGVVDDVLSLSAQPPEEHELELAQRGVLGDLARAMDAQGSLADLLLGYACAGAGPAAVQHFARDVAETGAQPVADAGTRLLQGLHRAATADVAALKDQQLPASWGA